MFNTIFAGSFCEKWVFRHNMRFICSPFLENRHLWRHLGDMNISKNSDILWPMAALHGQRQKLFVKAIWIEPVGDKCGGSEALERILRFFGARSVLTASCFRKDEFF